MKRTTPITLIAATLAVPGPVIAAATMHRPSWPESRKLVHVNRVDRVSTNVDWIRIEWPTRAVSAPASLVPILTPSSGSATVNDFYLPASEPAAIASSTRVEIRRPTLDPRSLGKRNQPS